jgi:hypothetical protein
MIITNKSLTLSTPDDTRHNRITKSGSVEFPKSPQKAVVNKAKDQRWWALPDKNAWKAPPVLEFTVS